MPVRNDDIARIFDQTADLLAIQGHNPFRIRAYRTAAQRIAHSPHDLAARVAAGEALPRIPGIGHDLAEQLREICLTGTSTTLENLQAETPATLVELLNVEGLGPKRIRRINQELGITSREELLQAIDDGRLAALPGFGTRLAGRIRNALATPAQSSRMLRADASRYAEELAAHLRTVAGDFRLEWAGSYRRGRETVGDLDLVVSGDGATTATRALLEYADVAEVLSAGETRATVRLRNGLQVDLRVVAAESHGAAMHYLTGSQAHNLAMRRLGQTLGLKINEYGVYRGDDRIAGSTETSVYAATGLPWIPPELRENRGEIEAAQEGKLPELVTRGQLRGDLHAHTTASDGQATLREMADAAQAQGLEYLAITDHSVSLRVANGLDSTRLLQQGETIDRLNDELHGFTLLKGCEVEILEDGRLDLPEATLSRLDVVIGAVHTGFGLSRQQQTDRILRAMDHRHFMLLAHPSGRLINKRAGYDVDLERIIRHAGERGCYVELNGNPRRLDLDDTHCRIARDAGVRISIDSDAHATPGFTNLTHGVVQGRRGWLTASHVLNTEPIDSLRMLLNKER